MATSKAACGHCLNARKTARDIFNRLSGNLCLSVRGIRSFIGLRLPRKPINQPCWAAFCKAKFTTTANQACATLRVACSRCRSKQRIAAAGVSASQPFGGVQALHGLATNARLFSGPHQFAARHTLHQPTRRGLHLRGAVSAGPTTRLAIQASLAIGVHPLVGVQDLSHH